LKHPITESINSLTVNHSQQTALMNQHPDFYTWYTINDDFARKSIVKVQN